MSNPAMYPAPPTTRMSTGPRAPAQRSSRRGGSTVPRATLGGGMGAMGGAIQAQGQGSTAVAGIANGRSLPPIRVPQYEKGQGVAKGDKLLSPTGSTYLPSPVPSHHSHQSQVSPRSSHFDTRTSNTASTSTSTFAGPSSRPSASASGSMSSRRGTPSTSIQSHMIAGSQASLATTASTSSRALKTPHYKSDPSAQVPHIATDSPLPSTSDSPANMLVARSPSAAPASPTPRRVSDGPKAHQLGHTSRSAPAPPIAIPSQPLPPLPSHTETPSSASTPPLRRAKPTPLRTDPQRLSQDWVEVPNVNGSEVGGPKRSSPTKTRLPAPQLVPMKASSPSPRRPSFDRSNTAPTQGHGQAPVSPTPNRRSDGRQSLDQLRATPSMSTGNSPSLSPRTRTNSKSTPPSVIMSFNNNGSVGKGGLFRAKSREARPKGLQPRKSSDMLKRPSMDIFARKDKEGKKDKEQKGLGMGTPPTSNAASPSTPYQKEDRKASASGSLSLKKSSGALRALFKTGKGKDKGEAVPAMPMFNKEAYMAGGEAMGRRSVSADERPRPPFARSVTPSAQSMGSPGSFDSPSLSDSNGQSRSSFAAERSFFPTPPPMSRAVSDGPQFILGQSAPCPPLKIAPATPPKPKAKPTPRLPPMSTSGTTPDWQSSSARPALPSSGTDTSLAYMARQSVMYDYGEEPSMSPEQQTGSVGGRTPPADHSLGLARHDAAVSRPLDAPASAAESSTSGASGSKGSSSGYGSMFDLPTSRSLHLLSLPDLDLSMDVSFDRFSSGSPGTPRKSPQRSMSLSRSPLSPSHETSPTPSPQRSMTMRQHLSPDHLSPTSGVKVERRRSQSFDGTGHTGTIISDLWRNDGNDGYVSPNVARLFGNPQSTSAPLLSKQLIAEDGQTKQAASLHLAEQAPLGSIDFSLPSGSFGAFAPEMSYAGSKDTCSGSSSNGMLQTASERSSSPSPSPPTTPVENKTHFGLAAAIEMDESRVKGGLFSAGPAPAIPLPLLPVVEITAKEPEPVVVKDAPTVVEKEELRVLVRPAAPPVQVRQLVSRARTISISQTPAYDVLSHELDNLLRLYRFPPSHLAAPDRANLVRNDLVGLLAELDRRGYEAAQEAIGVYGVLRRGCFDWAETLLDELRTEQPAHERGACLEGLAAVIESTCLSEQALKGARSPEHAKRFTGLMTRCMTFVMGKLGAKGVFHNTLLFSGRFLAFSFFRIPHIAEQLVTVLQPQRGALMRFTRSMLVDAKIPEEAKPVYPAHLAPLCFDDSRTYTARLAKLSPTFATAEERTAFLFQAGNWLRRWQSDDSELFPAFYRAYHRQLAMYLAPAVQHYEALNQPLPVSVLLRAPGYAHLATIFATKCHSYILGSVNAVTTSSSINNFEAQETAGFRGSQKPAVLETANRRLVETLSTFAGLRVIVPSGKTSGELVEVDGSQLYGGMIDAWTRNLVGKTSLYAPKAVFSLFDLLDGIVDSPYPLEEDSPADVTPVQRQSLLDVPHLIWTLRIILTQGEHALTLVKAIAFIFTHWEALTARPEDRRTLCLELLLQRELFERLLLFWSQSVRSYILRLVVFRLGHLHTTQQDGDAHTVEIESVKLLQTRLDNIKARHDELEPKPETDSAPSSLHEARPVTPVQGQSGTLTRSRSTITMVQDSPSRNGSANKAERLLGLGFGMENKEDDARIKPKSSLSAASAAGWFKKLGKKGKKDGSSSGSRSTSPSPNMGLSPSPNFASPAKLDNSPLVPGESAYTSRSPSGLAAPHQLKPAPSFSQRSPVSPLLSSSPTLSSESGSDSPVDGTPKKTPPPLILTSSPTSPSINNGVAFEFELPLASPRSDSFDPAPNVPPSPRKNQPASPGPASPHMSRTFSKRSSLLPPKTASVIEGLTADHGNGNRASLPPGHRRTPDSDKDVKEPGYDKKLHAYAIRMLAELEDAQKEYDEWWSDDGVGRMDGAPPRLAVAWPFHEGED